MTPQEYNKLREQEIIGQEMADETVKSIQLRKDIMKLALAESATIVLSCVVHCLLSLMFQYMNKWQRI